MEQGNFWDRVKAICRERPGRVIGTSIGLVIGICLISLGLWRTLVLVAVTAAGYSIGKWVDDEGKGLKEFLEEKLPGRPDFH